MAYPSKTSRRKIVVAALKLLARDGLAAASLRSLARALRLAPNALYRYFPDRTSLEQAIAADVAGTFHAMLVRAVGAKGPEESIRAIARAYLKFARERKFLYEALLVPRPASGEDAVAPEKLWRFAVQHAARVAGEARAAEATVAFWAFLHGMAALQSAEAFGEEQPFSSFEFGMAAWMNAARTMRDAETQRTQAGRAKTMILSRTGGEGNA
jgi:AcrR family transcriptional regulator